MSEITIKDIAEFTGVSYATVSRALNNCNGVNAATREKILSAAADLGYRPNLHARSLKTNKTNTIALLVPDISNPFDADIACAVNDFAFRKGYTTILCNTSWNPEIERAQIEQLMNQRVDGILYKPAGNLPLDLSEMDIPCVVLDCEHRNNKASIVVDNRKGGSIAAKHLVECGYSRFSFIGGPEEMSSNFSMRMEGFVEGLAAFGQKMDPKHISFGSSSIESGYRQIQNMLKKGGNPDGIFCGSDVIALGVMQYLLENAYRIPEDMGIIGYDGIEFAGLPQIQLTTISQPRQVMGAKAAEMLIEQIQEETQSPFEQITLIPELTVRRSTRKTGADRPFAIIGKTFPLQ